MKNNNKKKASKPAAVAVVESGDAATARQLVSQYHVVIAAEKSCFRERVKFGAMLIEWGNFLGESRGCASGGEGLKGWLEKNCPELTYPTAMEYKHYAEKALAMLGNSASAVAALLGRDQVVQPDGETVDADAEVVKKCDDLFENVTSRRKLEQAWFDFMGDAGGKKKSAKRGEPAELPKPSALENAKTIWVRTLAAISSKTVKTAIALLPEKETEVCWGVVKDLYEALKEHRAEFKD